MTTISRVSSVRTATPVGSTHKQSYYVNDDSKVVEITEALKGTYAVVLLGYSEQDYAEQDRVMRQVLSSITDIMMKKRLSQQQISLVASGTKVGIGRAYQVVRKEYPEIKTVGIVSTHAEKEPALLSAYCVRKIFVPPPAGNPSSWDTSNEKGESFAVIAAMLASEGGTVIKLGGSVISRELELAKKRGIAVEEYTFAPKLGVLHLKRWQRI